MTANKHLPPVDEATRAFRARMVAKAKAIAEQLAANAPAPASTGDEWTPASTAGTTSVDGGSPYRGPLGDRLRANEEAQAAADKRRAPPGAGIDGQYRGPLANRLIANERAAEAKYQRERAEASAAVPLRCPCGVPLVVEHGADVARAAHAHGWVQASESWFCSLQHAAQFPVRAAAAAPIKTLAEIGAPAPANPRGRALWEAEQAALREKAYAPPAPAPLPVTRRASAKEG